MEALLSMQCTLASNGNEEGLQIAATRPRPETETSTFRPHKKLTSLGLARSRRTDGVVVACFTRSPLRPPLLLSAPSRLSITPTINDDDQ